MMGAEGQSKEEKKIEEVKTTTMIVTTSDLPKKEEPSMTSSKVGTNNCAFSRMPVEQKHYIIA